MVEFAIEAYQVFSRKIHDLPTFVFEPSERELKQISNFIDILEKKYSKSSVGRIFLFNFMAFGYDYYSTLDHNAKRIPVNWILGKKMLTRWINRSEDDLYHSAKYVSEKGIHVGLIKAGTKKKGNEVVALSTSEEIEKSRFHNTSKGLINCLDATTLFNHRSAHCISCIFRDSCKVSLKTNFPRIYITRGYLK